MGAGSDYRTWARSLLSPRERLLPGIGVVSRPHVLDATALREALAGFANVRLDWL